MVQFIPSGLIAHVGMVILTDCSVVFSTWRLTLDVVEAGLNRHSIANVRFDGKVTQKNRQSVVNRFKTDPKIRVMLLTLSCGAVG
jgi:SNF2 family DNA or RNA helicase